jgi:tRNA nucleotidyltransferase (CCA-adding enzyme)
MADYLYMMETRLSPEQQRAAKLAVDIARAHEMNIYLTGGAMRDMVSGFTIRDLDFTTEGNPLKLERDLEKNGVAIQGKDEDLRSLLVQFPGNVRAELSMARSERFPKPGRPPEIASATIIEDLRRRDFTFNAIALSLNPGSRGLLLDPTNGLADIEAKLLRILQNYSFLEDPSRLIRATRFMARFHWTMEERTQGRYDAAKENGYIEHISDRARGYEIEQLAYEDEPLAIMKALEREEWLKVLHPHWSPAKVDTSSLSQLLKTRQQMVEVGYSNVDPAPAVLYFLTARMNQRDSAEMQKLIPRKGLVDAWENLEQEAKQLAKLLTGKEAATPSRTWKLLSSSRPETILFLETTSRQQAVTQKIRNFFGKWRQVKQRFPLPEMPELRITPELPIYPKLVEDMFYLMLDGKLRSSSEIIKFLKPHSPPPPPPPPPPPKRGRAAKAAEPAATPAAAAEGKGRGRKKKGVQPAPVPAAVPPAAATNPKAAKPEEKKVETKAGKPVPPKAAAPANTAVAPAKKSAPIKKAAPAKKTAPKKPAKKRR